MKLRSWFPAVVCALALSGAPAVAREARASAPRPHHVAAARNATARVVRTPHRHHARVAHESRAFAAAQPTHAPARPAPVREAPRPRHGATPHATRLARHVPERRAPGEATCATAETALRAPRVSGAASAPSFIPSWSLRFGPIEGRGPPRAGPLSRTLLSERAPTFLRARRSRLPEPVRLEHSLSAPSRPTRAFPGVAPDVPVAVQPERHSGRSHVGRLEGATACFCMPSIGGFTT